MPVVARTEPMAPLVRATSTARTACWTAIGTATGTRARPAAATPAPLRDCWTATGTLAGTMVWAAMATSSGRIRVVTTD